MRSFKKVIFFLCLLVTGLANAEISINDKAETTRRPVITLQEATHAVEMEGSDKTIWKQGSLNPAFVLYDDGLVIFKKGGDRFELFAVALTPREMGTLLEEFKINEFLKLQDSHSTNNNFHPPIYFIKYWRGLKMKKVRVIGSLRDNEQDRKAAPREFLTIFDRMISFQHKKVRPWSPEKIQIDLYPYKDSKGEPVPWPAGWPDLNHKTTQKRTDAHLKHAYTMYLDGANKAEIEKLLSGLKENQAVLINQQQWYIAPIRYILPNEEMWDTERSVGPWDTIRVNRD